jgi:hypothetical protein
MKSNTQKISDKKNPLELLVNLNVICPTGYLINSFVLKENDTNIFYDYNCVKSPLEKCETKYISLKTENLKTKSLSELDKFKIKANEGFGIQKFNAENTNGEMKYDWIECKLHEISKNELIPNTTDNHKGSLNTTKESIEKHEKEIENEKIIGTNFCIKNCKIQDKPVYKKCFDQNVKKCKYCVFIHDAKNREENSINELCMNICNHDPETNKCAFYPFKMIIKKKDYNSDLLKKLGIRRLFK